MSILTFLYIALLFFALVPGVLLSLPKKGSKTVVAGVHALVFGVILYFTLHIVNRIGVSLEGFTDPPMEDSTTESSEENTPEETTAKKPVANPSEKTTEKEDTKDTNENE